MRPSLHYRFFEVIPAIVVWTTLIGSVVLSFTAPIIALYAIIAFDLYWLFRVTYFVFYLLIAWRRYREHVSIAWDKRLHASSLPWRTIIHCIFLPTYKEPISVIRKTLQALSTVRYDTKHFLIILAGEERDREHFLKIAETLQHEFQGVFFDFLVTLHPRNLPDEIPGKGSNLHYAGEKVQEYIDAKHIAYSDCIVSTFDIDTIVHPQYFSYLTYIYCSTPDRQRVSYQPVALYNNNIWESNVFIRVASFGTTFWLMTELVRPERLFTFSSHSMSWQALVDVGFWEKRIVTEDSRIFLQGLIHYQGNYRVQPLYIPVSMNTVMVDSLWRSLVNLYKQQRRWAWGIEHFPYMLWHFFFQKNTIPRSTKFFYLWNLGEGMFSWATAPLLIFVLGRFPFWFAGDALQKSALYHNTPFVLESLLRLAMIGIFVSAILSLLLLPPHPGKRHPFSSLIMLVQWILLPVTIILFGSIPAIEAQTRLALGKKLGFWVTEKT
ncbi:MAG: glycosyltransferase family 2 protein [bacterium]|nr:glycosyltransferase family 2 protein [bacterium]